MKILSIILMLPLMVLENVSAETFDVLALENEIERISRTTNLWPGFDPTRIPLAVFDGTNTYLLHHPGTPGGFIRVGHMKVYSGRHPCVLANTATSIGGVITATIMVDQPLDERTLRDFVARAIHEAFRVFQTTTPRTWGADETQMLLYPVNDIDLLILRRLETDALRRALEARDRLLRLDGHGLPSD